MEHSIIPQIQQESIIKETWIEVKNQEDRTNGQCYLISYNGEGQVKFKDNSQYEGEMKNGYLHGQGIFQYINGTKIEMNFNFNKFDGHAKITFKDDSKYIGEVKNGFRHGQGIFNCNEYEYEGQYRDGKKQGHGLLKMKNQQIYIGNFHNDYKQGYGEQQYNNGNWYKGEWNLNKKEGNGIMYWKSSQYNGQWSQDQPNGLGQLIWLDEFKEKQYMRNKYSGHWINGKRHGYGIFYYANGSRYEGEWENNYKHGKAIFVYENGVNMFLNFKDDKQVIQEVIDKEKEEWFEDLFLLKDINIQNDFAQKLNKMLLRNHILLTNIYKVYQNNDFGQQKNLDCFGMRLFQFQHMIKDAKLLEDGSRIYNLNRQFSRGSRNQLFIHNDIDFIKFKINMFQQTNKKQIDNYCETFLEFVIKNYDHSENYYKINFDEIWEKFYQFRDVHDQNQIIMNLYFILIKDNLMTC